MYGSIPGRQTVPRAEGYALVIFLEFIKTLEGTIGCIEVFTDSKLVYDGIRSRKAPDDTHFGQVWVEIWELWKQVHELGWVITVHKVKAHTTQEDVDEGRITEEDREGNRLADAWAKKAVAKYQVKWDKKNCNDVENLPRAYVLR